MGSQELIDFVNNELPGENGWWNCDTPNSMHRLCGILLSKGCRVEEIKEILIDVYSSVSGEFG